MIRRHNNTSGDASNSRRLRSLVVSIALYVVAAVAALLLWPTSLGGCTTLTIVSGHSMEPTYYTGDLVVARCATASVGDVIVYQPKDLGGARIIHRITGGDATTGWVMQGDNNKSADPFNPAGSEVLGVAKVYLPKVGLIARGLTSPFVWGSFILIAIGLFVWPRGENEEENEEADDESLAVDDTGAPTDADVAPSYFATVGQPGHAATSELPFALETDAATDNAESGSPSADPVHASVLDHR